MPVQVTERRGATGVVQIVSGSGGFNGDGTPDVPDIFPVAVPGAAPYDIFVRFEVTDTLNVLEGSTDSIKALLSQPTFQEVYVPFAITGGTLSTLTTLYSFVPEGLYFYFPPGAQEAEVFLTTDPTAGDSSSRNLVLDLDPDLSASYVDETGTPYRVVPADINETLDVIVSDTGAGTPTWTFAASTASIPEQAGTVDLDISFNPAPTDVVRLLVQTADGTGTAGSNYVAVNEEIEFLVGQANRTVAIPIVNDNIDQPVDVNFSVSASIVSGTAANGAITSVTVTIEDDDDGGGPGDTPVLRWFQTSGSVQEGSTSQDFAAILYDQNGNPTTFGSQVNVPITIGGTASEEDDFQVLWGSNPPGFLRFSATDLFQRIRIQAWDDGQPDPSENVTLTLETEETGAYTVPSGTATLTVTITEEVTVGETQLLVPSATSTARRMIQGLVAIDPPSATLPVYELSTGETVQLMGMRRNGDDLWEAGYFYGFATNAESVPGQGGELTIGAQTTGVAPPEDGSFATPPVLDFDLRLANVGTLFTAQMDEDIAGAREVMTGTGAGWAMSGPEVVQETIRRMQFASSGTFNGSVHPSGSGLNQGAGYIEVCETVIAGEDNVFLYQGRFGPTGWRNQNVQAENAYCDGEMYVERLRAKVPAGWSVQFVDPHPNQGGNGTATGLLLRGRSDGSGNDQPYWFGAGQSMTFWFAVTLDSDADAVTRATDYIRQRHIAWAVGALGSTNNAIYNEPGDLTPDWNRTSLVDPSNTSRQGWEAIKFFGEATQATAISQWTSGSKLDGGGPRRGAWVEPPIRGGGSVGGEGIYGSYGYIPTSGYWYRRLMLTNREGWRMPHYVVMETGESVWSWENTSEIAGETRANQTGMVNEWQGGKRLYQFNDHRIVQRRKSEIRDKDPAVFAAAPTSRPWNYPVTIDDSTLTVASLRKNGNTITGDSGAVDEVVCNTTIPAGTPAAGTITIEWPTGYRQKAQYSSWSGDTFTLFGDFRSAGRDFQEYDDYTGFQITTMECDPEEGYGVDFLLHDAAHAARHRDGYVDQWLGMRSFLGLQMWRNVAADVTRTWNPWLVRLDFDSFMMRTTNLGDKVRSGLSIDGWRNTGAYVSGGRRDGSELSDPAQWSIGRGVSCRGQGWHMVILGGSFQIETDDVRAAYRGKGTVESLATPRSQLDLYADWMDYLRTPIGTARRGVNTGSPDPWEDKGPTDYATRTGNAPDAADIQDSLNAGYVGAILGAKHFQTYYYITGARALRKCFPEGSARQTACDRSVRYFQYLTQATQAFLGVPPQGTQLATELTIVGYAPTVDQMAGVYPSTPPARVELDDYLNGDYVWMEPGGSFEKVLWGCQGGYITFNEDSFIQIAKAFWSRPNDSDQEFLDYLMSPNGADVSDEMSDGGDGEVTFVYPMIALLATRV